MTKDQQHDWALAIAEWAERLAAESQQLAKQARAICERVSPEKYEKEVDSGSAQTR